MLPLVDLEDAIICESNSGQNSSISKEKAHANLKSLFSKQRETRSLSAHKGEKPIFYQLSTSSHCDTKPLICPIQWKREVKTKMKNNPPPFKVLSPLKEEQVS